MSGYRKFWSGGVIKRVLDVWCALGYYYLDLHGMTDLIAVCPTRFDVAARSRLNPAKVIDMEVGQTLAEIQN